MGDKKVQYKYREGISLEEAIRCICDFVKPIEETEWVELLESRGRILACDEKADIDNPPFDRSPIDGYACRAEDTRGASLENPVTLAVLEEIDAGQYSERTIEQGQAVRIMTGAAIPKGCDCCLRQEDTDYGEKFVRIYREQKPHDNYCDRGEDFLKGTKLLSAGEKIGYIEIGNLAGMGCDRALVYRKPRVALITTGDEVMFPGQPLRPGKIYNSNFYLLIARLQEYGICPIVAKAVSDDAGSVAEAIREAVDAGADLVLTTGGVSVGKKDILHEALPILGAEKLFWRVKLKPGTPTIFSVYQGIPIISLSGNPFGAIANLELLVRPALAKLMREPSLSARKTEGIMADSFLKASHGRRFVRACYENGMVSLPKGLHSSGVLSSMKGCNCLIDIAPGTEKLAAGDVVTLWML